VSRRISSLRRNLFSGLANLIATVQFFQWAGKSHRCAAIVSVVRRIPLPCRILLSGPVNLIAAPQSFQRAGKSHHRAAIFSAGRQTQSFQWASAFHRQAAKSHLGRRIIVMLAVSHFILKSRIIIELRQH